MGLAIRQDEANPVIPGRLPGNIRCDQNVSFRIGGKFCQHLAVFIDRIITGRKVCPAKGHFCRQNITGFDQLVFVHLMMFITQVPEN